MPLVLSNSLTLVLGCATQRNWLLDDFQPSLCGGVCGRLPAFVASKGQEKGNLSLTAPSERPRQLPCRNIQSFIEAGEPRVVGSCTPGDLGERRQMDAVEASKAVLLGKLA